MFLQRGVPEQGSTSVTHDRNNKSGTAAHRLRGFVHGLLGDPIELRVEFWDGSQLGSDASPNALVINSPDVFRQLMWAPGELGFARAYVSGDIDLRGDVIETMFALSRSRFENTVLLRNAPSTVAALKNFGTFSGRPDVPVIEYQPPRFGVHTKGRDAAAISHHYDVSNDFYELVLGPSMTYSCARFSDATYDLTQAQQAKHDHIARKLGLANLENPRLLDVGCGWGSMAIHAAKTYGAQVVGITISREQAARARERVAAAGVGDLVEIRLQDYRDLSGETFDAISSVGMSEHVGKTKLEKYFRILRGVLRDEGRLLNHAISSVGGSKLSSRSFMYRYVFPDGELIDLAVTIAAMQRAGFEVRDVESLREHYATTLRHWVTRLQDRWDDAVAEVGLERARVWLLYMTASSVGFSDGGLNLYQVLGVVEDPDGGSGMPPIRAELVI